MGGACIIPCCSIETVCGIGASAVAIGAKVYEINKIRKKRANSLPNQKILLPPPIIHKKRLRNNTE
jgi:hypothetical protein